MPCYNEFLPLLAPLLPPTLRVRGKWEIEKREALLCLLTCLPLYHLCNKHYLMEKHSMNFINRIIEYNDVVAAAAAAPRYVSCGCGGEI